MNEEEKPLLANDEPEKEDLQEAKQEPAQAEIQGPPISDSFDGVEPTVDPEGEATELDVEAIVQPVVEAPPEVEEPKPPSRLGRFTRRALRWVTGLVVVFALGVVLIYGLRVRPLVLENQHLQSQLSDAQTQVTSLQADLAGAQERAETLREDADRAESQALELQEALDESEEHLGIMRVLVDVTTAQIALAQEDTLAAKAALANTDDRLADLEGMLEGEASKEISDLRDRLKLALSGIDDNLFSAERDLEILANNLIALEKVLFP